MMLHPTEKIAKAGKKPSRAAKVNVNPTTKTQSSSSSIHSRLNKPSPPLPSAMLNLPLEVLRSVLQYVPKQDLHALRLTCHSINDTAVSYLYCDLTVWLQRQSLERLLNISRCNSINRHVRNLTLGFEILPKVVPSPERYLQWLYHQQHFQDTDDGHPHRTYPLLTFTNIGNLSGRSDWTKERIRMAYDAYKHGIEDQNFMETTGMDVVALAASFSRLENLRSIVIKSDYYGPMTDPTEVPKDMAVLIKELLLLPAYNREMREQDAGRRQLRNIIRAAWAANITELTLSDLNNTMTPRILALRPEDLYLAITTFQHVKKFYFKLPDFTSKEEDGDIFAAGQLAKLVQAMGRLEELTLVSSSYNPYVPWSSICGAERLPFLRVLDLQSFDFHEKEFMDFLIRHKSTLRTVKLFCVEMYSGTFTSLFQGMRENLSLGSLELTGVLEDTTGNFLDYSYAAAEALGDFVTRRSQVFPVDLLQRHQRGGSEDGE